MGKFFDILNAKDKKLTIFIFLFNKISFSKICNRCARKVFKLSIPSSNVTQHVFFISCNQN
jgi:hypothetical protein